MLLCPCGSQNTYESCCGLYLDKAQRPQTPEQLMRSRYTAYSLAKIEYITNTMRGKALLGFNHAEAKTWAERLHWLGLKVINSYMETPDKGFVEFKATFLDRNQLQEFHELSEFHKEQETWFYVDGINKQIPGKNNKQKIARNSFCPCGSGKKFKNCHEK